MSIEYENIFPRWLQEFKRFQNLKSQFYLHGNIYDCFYFPVNHRVAKTNDDLTWALMTNIVDLLNVYFANENYDLICQYDIVDGLEIKTTSSNISRKSILKFLADINPKAEDFAKNTNIEVIDKNIDEAISFFRHLLANNQKSVVGIVNFASRLATAPGQLTENESKIFLKIVKAAQEAAMHRDQNKRNILIFICDKLSDIPAWVLLDNPLTKGIEIQKPNKDERRRFFLGRHDMFFNDDSVYDIGTVGDVFTDLTDGLTNRELENIISLSKQDPPIPIYEMKKIIDLFKYGTKENFWEKLESSKVDNADITLRERVLGQDFAVNKAVEIIRRAYLGLHALDQSDFKHKPKGVLFFAGPTGVGKTELAKALAHLIFNDDNAIIRFDMSEYKDSNSGVKLIGSPPGYIGYDEGGQLTKRIRSKPFSILLFDEIEKAHPLVFEYFLQILDDGRLTDGKGETVYFSESLIIFTSNLGVDNVSIKDDYETNKDEINKEIQIFFKGFLKRPELLNRFGENFVVFDFIRPDIARKLLVRSLELIKKNLKKLRNCDFDYDDEFVDAFLSQFVEDNLDNGGRGINNRVEEYVKNGITSFLFKRHRMGKGENIGIRPIVNIELKTVNFECIGD